MYIEVSQCCYMLCIIYSSISSHSNRTTGPHLPALLPLKNAVLFLNFIVWTKLSLLLLLSWRLHFSKCDAGMKRWKTIPRKLLRRLDLDLINQLRKNWIPLTRLAASLIFYVNCQRYTILNFLLVNFLAKM